MSTPTTPQYFAGLASAIRAGYTDTKRELHDLYEAGELTWEQYESSLEALAESQGAAS